jgi:hypothetical protein
MSEPANPRPPLAPDQPSPKRPLPDFDGRGPEPTTAGKVALWVSRVVLSPLYLASEYVIRWPLSVTIPAAERADLPRKIYDFFAFGPEHKSGVVPVGMYEFDFNPSFGIYAFWTDAGFRGDDWHAHIEAWPAAWIGGSLQDYIQIDSTHAAQFRLEGVRRPDRVFYGIGPDTRQGYQSRYGTDRVDASALYEWRFWRATRIQLATGLRTVNLYNGRYGNDPSIETEAATGAFTLPPGFSTGYTAEYNRALFVLDTRPPQAAPGGTAPAVFRAGPGSGLYAELQAEQGSDVRQAPASGWIRYGATAGASLDLNQGGRVIGLALTTLFADPLGSRAVPFTELASLGGDGPMPAYFPGRMVDRSAAAMSAHYQWPVGPWIDGTIEAAIGNVFDEHLQGFRAGRLRFSGDLGLWSQQLGGDYPIEMIFGAGSETFEQGGTIDSFRFTVSLNHGF